MQQFKSKRKEKKKKRQGTSLSKGNTNGRVICYILLSTILMSPWFSMTKA